MARLRAGHEDHEGHKEHEEERGGEALAGRVVDSALKVHRCLGPGLLESTYEHCLAHEFSLRGISVQRQVSLPIIYEGLRLEVGYRLDIVVENAIIVEIKSVEKILPLHQAQVLTYLRFAPYRLAFLMNFNVPLFKDGLKRFIL